MLIKRAVKIKAKNVFYFICLAMFVSGIVTGLIGRAICVHDNENYETILPEITIIEEISHVLKDQNGNIYVCYNDASCVNVYDYDGNFIWAVSVPYLRNSYFELRQSNLIIYNYENAYIYDIEDKRFISKSLPEAMDLEFVWQNSTLSLDDLAPGDVYFDTYNVYRIDDDGVSRTLIEKPLWYYVFHFPFDWLFSFTGALLAGIFIFFSKTVAYFKSKSKRELEDKRTVNIQKYIKIMIAVNVTFIFINIVGSIFFNGIFVLGIFPVGLNFIIGNVIVANMREKQDHLALEFWTICNFASFIIAFFSVVAVAATYSP